MRSSSLTKQTRITIDNINVTKINNMTTTEVRIEIEGTKLKVSGYYNPAELQHRRTF